MQPKITGENDERVGISVIDNNDIEHLIEMEFDGEIQFHECDAYPDRAEDRAPENDEHVSQVRRYAQYYVFLERGYDTLPSAIHPGYINAVRLLVRDLPDEEFTTLFRDLYRQMRSHHDAEVDRVIPIPADAAGPDSVMYRKHVYLALDAAGGDLSEAIADFVSESGLDLPDADFSETDPVDTDIGSWESFTGEVADLLNTGDVSAPEGVSLGGVSSLYTAYIDSGGIEHIGEPDRDPVDREPDTLVELAPVDPGPIEEFRAFLDHHLRCQVRDCFIRMGVQPPQEFRVLGVGHFEAAEQYKLREMFPDYTDPDNQGLLW